MDLIDVVLGVPKSSEGYPQIIQSSWMTKDFRIETYGFRDLPF
jgi:hypothetical protein